MSTSHTQQRPTILITGATRGIGRATALALKDEAHLILTARDSGALEQFASELPWASWFVLDLEDPASIGEAINREYEAGGLAGVDSLDGVVLSAAVWEGGTILDSPAEAWERVLSVNVSAQAALVRSLLPLVRKGRGTLVFINSGSGFTSKPTNSLYSASKFALRALSDALREEEREHGVRVTSVHPGRVATDMQRALRAAEGGEYVESDYVAPQTIASAIRFALNAGVEASVDEISIRPR